MTCRRSRNGTFSKRRLRGRGRQSVHRRRRSTSILRRTPKGSVPGFYDGEGIYRVRFMPDTRANGLSSTRSNAAALDGKTGSFRLRPPEGQSRPGPRAQPSHFAYADGAPYFPFGTTCYAWTHQPLAMQGQTLATCRRAGFNKLAHGRLPQALHLQRERAALRHLRARRRRRSSISTGRTSSPSGISRRRSAPCAISASRPT